MERIMTSTHALVLRMLVSLECAIVVGCSAPHSSLTYHKGSSDGKGYDFVIPRTVLKIAPGAAGQPTHGTDADSKTVTKAVGSNNISFTVVPVITDVTEQPLPRFWVSDDASGGFELTPTTITTATYADNLVLSAIGTQLTDNRTAAIDAGVSVLGLVARAFGLPGFASSTPEDCTKSPALPAFAIDSFDQDVTGAFVPGTQCWGYDLKTIQQEKSLDPNVKAVATDFPPAKSVNWFPYPGCRIVMVTVYACDANSAAVCKKASGQNPTVQTLNVSTGTLYRRMLLPSKGKIAFHSDFCGVDITNDGSGAQSNWALLKQAISDYNNLKQSKSTSSTAAKKGS
jgi:hypothetical protein